MEVKTQIHQAALLLCVVHGDRFKEQGWHFSSLETQRFGVVY